MAERGDQAVALRKVRRQRWRAQRVFADQAAAKCHRLGQRLVALGVDAVQPGAHHRHRGQWQMGAPAQGPFVRGGVNAQGQARDHAHPTGGQILGKSERVLAPLGCGVAAAHHRQGGSVQWRGLALQVQHQRRVTQLQKSLGVGGVAQGQNLMHTTRWGVGQPVLSAGQAQGCVCGWAAQGGGRSRPHPVRPISLVGGQHLGWPSKCTEQLTELARAHARCGDQTQPIGPVGCDGGCGCHGCLPGAFFDIYHRPALGLWQ